MKHTNLIDEIMTEEPKDRSHIYLGIAIGVIVTLCAGILVFGLVVEGLIN
jgi:hypothetical protein